MIDTRTADELNDIMRLMMKAALKRMVDTMKSIHILILALCLTNTGFAQPGGSTRGIINNAGSPHAVLNTVGIGDVRWTDGFWAEKFGLCHDVMLDNLWTLYNDPDKLHAMKNFRILAGLEDGDFKGSKWIDGDFYKWMEAVSYVYAATGDVRLERHLDEIIPVIARGQEPGGYINTRMILEKLDRWTDIVDHETYNMGHLMTSACIHYRATGKTGMLEIAKKAGDCLYDAFMDSDRHFIGYSSIMGLVELYRTTGDKKYLDLAVRFVDMQGEPYPGGRRPHLRNGLYSDQRQDMRPLRRDTRAVGHAVWGGYLYSGAADVVAETGDTALLTALEAIWQDVAARKMYITGASTASHEGEKFGQEYVLHNARAYNETCSNIAAAMWNWRMLGLTGDARYADRLELILYNSALSSISADGTKFFYANPIRLMEGLHLHVKYGPQRWVQIKETCCPPNIVRTIAKAHGWVYNVSQEGLWINLYGGNELKTTLPDGTDIRLVQETDYPWGGQVSIRPQHAAHRYAIRLRIPGWAANAGLTVNGQPANVKLQPGTYATVERTWKTGDEIALDLPMPATLLSAHPLLEEAANQVAVKRGPLVYCLESVDIPDGVRVRDVRIPADTQFTPSRMSSVDGGIVQLKARAVAARSTEWGDTLYRTYRAPKLEPVDIRLTPYYYWHNRGLAEMTVWMPVLQ
jgi:DUF1680 family protein